MGRRKKNRQIQAHTTNVPVVMQAPSVQRYMIDESGYVGTMQPIEWQAKEPKSANQHVPKSEKSKPATNLQQLEEIPEAVPSGFIDLLNIPKIKVLATYPLRPKETPTSGRQRGRQIEKAEQSASAQKRREQTLQNVKPTAVDLMVQCPYCTAMVRQSRLKRHQGKVHAKQVAQQNATRGITRPSVADEVLRFLGKSTEVVVNNPQIERSLTTTTKVAQSISVPATTIRTDLTVCPICAVSVRMDRFDRHLRKVHQQGVATVSASTSVNHGGKEHKGTFIICHACNQSVKQSKFAQHLLKFHKTSNSSPVQASACKTNKRAANSEQRYQTSSHSQNDKKSRAALDQSFHEASFGGKYIGQMRREGSGRFGSTPLYDDYSDEAYAD